MKQPCELGLETYEHTNSCVRKITQFLYNFTQVYTILLKLCNFAYTTVGSYV